MAQTSPRNTEGFYAPTTSRYDSQYIQAVDINSPEFKQFLIDMQQIINDYAYYINKRTVGSYLTQEILSGQEWFSTSKGQQSSILRQNYRTVVNFGGLPDAGDAFTKSIAHNIDVDASTIWTLIRATATDPVALTGIPMANEYLSVDATNVTINTMGTDLSAYTTCVVVLEYLKNV